MNQRIAGKCDKQVTKRPAVLQIFAESTAGPIPAHSRYPSHWLKAGCGDRLRCPLVVTQCPPSVGTSQAKSLAFTLKFEQENSSRKNISTIMTEKFKIALVTVAAGVLAGSVQAAGNNGDLLIGFSDQTHNDVIFDLGPAASLTGGKTWNLGPSGYNLLGDFDLTQVYWGVIGDTLVGSTGYAWATKPVGTLVPGKLAGLTAWGALDTAQTSIFNNFSPAGSSGSTSPGDYVSVDPLNSVTYPNGWNIQTISGTLTTDYHKAYVNPNVQGLTSDNFYQIIANNTAPTLLGGFTLDASGVVTYNVVGNNPPAPKIVSVIRAGTTTTISFTTTNTYTYTLYYTNSAGLGAAVTNWPKSAITVTGPGSGVGGTNQLTDTTVDSARFYRIGAK
jgi:hypothetical protein